MLSQFLKTGIPLCLMLTVSILVNAACGTVAPQVVEAEVTRQVEVEVIRQVEGEAEGSLLTQSQRAIQLGKQFAGTTIRVCQEDIQCDAVDLLGPQFEEATGMTVECVRTPFSELYTLGLQDGAAQDGSVDILSVSYAWVPDWDAAGTIRPIDEVVTNWLW